MQLPSNLQDTSEEEYPLTLSKMWDLFQCKHSGHLFHVSNAPFFHPVAWAACQRRTRHSWLRAHPEPLPVSQELPIRQQRFLPQLFFKLIHFRIELQLSCWCYQEIHPKPFSQSLMVFFW
jgi:hypothetical protein